MTQDPKEPFPFTEARLRELPEPPSGKRTRYRDKDQPGLILRVTTGQKVFAFRNRAAEVTIGRWPTMTVEKARAQVRTKIAPDPVKAAREKRHRRQAATLRETWEELLANPVRRDGRGPLRPATLASYRDAWGHIESRLGGRILGEITGEDVASLRAAVAKNHGVAQARQAMALISLLMGGLPRQANGRRVGRPSIEPRRRFLDASELGAILRGLEAEPHLWRGFLLCSLMAPLPGSNITSTLWAGPQLDHPARRIVSANDAKGGKLLAMPIAEPLAVILRDWRKQNPTERYVFPAGLTGGPRKGAEHIKSVQHAWRRALMLGEAVRICDALAGQDGRARFQTYLDDVAQERLRAWSGRHAPRQGSKPTKDTPLERMLEHLRQEAANQGIDPIPLAIADATPHDLRRTAASWAVQSGASLAVVAASLGHADTRVTEAHYGHLSDDPVRRMLGENAARILSTTAMATGAD
jgi:integrase